MFDIIKQMIATFHQENFKSGSMRQLQLIPVEGKASICFGVRRCGKSTYMLQIIEGLILKGVAKENIIHLNFFDDRLHGLQGHDLGIILEAYFSMFPLKKNSEKIYCFFDEIQEVRGWEPFVERLLRKENCQVFITGSSAKMLSIDIATQMRGRGLGWEMFPFTFSEFLTRKGISLSKNLSDQQQYLVQNTFEEFWHTGGFPEVFGLEQNLKIKIHQDYFKMMLFRDIIERHDISHPKAVIDLAHWFINHVGSLYSVNKLEGYLKSLGFKTSKEIVSNYIEYFEDAFIFFTVRIFDTSINRRNSNPKKIYCIDHALVSSIHNRMLVNSGHLLENLVFIALRNKTSEIAYYKTNHGREVDFITINPDNSRQLTQVCEHMLDEKTRKREIDALIEAMEELKLSDGYIVTKNQSETIKLDKKVIHVVPIWKYLI